MNQLAGRLTTIVYAVFFLLVSAVAATDELIIDAEDFEPAAYKGKVLYLDFWASWCGPCRATFPLMNDLRQTYSEDELAIVAVNLDGQRSNADRFLKQYPASFSVLYDPEGVLASRYQLPGMPTSYTYDSHGELVHTHIGFQENDAAVVRERLAELLNSKQ
ncbi:MAG: TlpA disulfide reductase family protein [Pseudomonadota bacterium]